MKTMSGFMTLVVMAVLLAASSFCIGMLPLFFAFSRSSMSKLAALGSGLLLGTGLGIIIPEGIEAFLEAGEDSSDHTPFPTMAVAFPLLAGFTLMLVTDWLLLRGGHSHSGPAYAPPSGPISPRPSTIEFDADVELGELEDNSIRSPHPATPGPAPTSAQRPTTPRTATGDGSETPAKGFPLLFGLVLHAAADGLALGSSIASDTGSQGLSLVVFTALAVHKAPTALALTTSLLAGGVDRGECQFFLSIFSVTTPIGAFFAYIFLWSFQSAGTGWTGIAMLISGGSFLYVATVLQPISSNNTPHESEISEKTRLWFIVSGMFAPLLLSILVGHGHP